MFDFENHGAEKLACERAAEAGCHSSRGDGVDFHSPDVALMEREVVGEDRADSVMATELLAFFEWMTAGMGGAKKKIAWRDLRARGIEELVDEERAVHLRCRDVSLRVLAVAWVNFPTLLNGHSLTVLAARLGVSKQVMDHYVSMFSERYGIRGRGQKSAEAARRYSVIQTGNQNRRKKNSKQESKTKPNEGANE